MSAGSKLESDHLFIYQARFDFPAQHESSCTIFQNMLSDKGDKRSLNLACMLSAGPLNFGHT